MAQRKRTSRSTEAEIKKNRLDFLKLECEQNNKHMWMSASAPGWEICSICKAAKRGEAVKKVEPRVKCTDKCPGTDVGQKSLWD